MKKTIICVVGRNSAGKSIIAKKIAERHGLNVVKSYTTRKPRPEEIMNGLENSDHIFISDEEFDELTGVVAMTTINNIRYCTTMDVLNKCDLYVIDPKGIKTLKENAGDKFHIVQFYIYADENIRKNRYIKRGESKDDFISRNNSENLQFSDYELNHGFDILIYNNGDIDDAVNVMDSYVSVILEGRVNEIEEDEHDNSEHTDVVSLAEKYDKASDKNINASLENITESEVEFIHNSSDSPLSNTDDFKLDDDALLMSKDSDDVADKNDVSLEAEATDPVLNPDTQSFNNYSYDAFNIDDNDDNVNNVLLSNVEDDNESDDEDDEIIEID